MADDKLIFVISQPRSGSTLVQSILLNSDDIKGDLNESWFLLPYLSTLRHDLNYSVYDLRLVEKGTTNFISKDMLRQKVSDFVSDVYKSKYGNGSKYYLDKTPRYYEILNEIKENLPGAKVIVLLRNPLDVMVSILKRWKPSRLRDLAFFSRDILEAPILIQEFLAKEGDNPNVFVARYEDIVLNPQVEFKRMFNWLNIDYQDAYLSYSVDKSPVLGDNKLMTHTKTHTSSINSYRSALNKRWMNRVLNGYKGYLNDRGYNLYEIESDSKSRNWTFKFFLNYHLFQKDLNRDLRRKSLSNIWYYLLMKIF